MNENEKAKPFYLKKLHEVYLQRSLRNPQYSMRAYARDLKINSAALSMYLRGTRRIPGDQLTSIIRALKLSQKEHEKFVSSASPEVKINGSLLLKDENNFEMLIRDWDCQTILSLFRLDKVDSSPAWISKRTGISIKRSSECLEYLIDRKLLVREPNGVVRRNQTGVHTTHGISSQIIRQGHLNTLELAKSKLESIPLNERDFTFTNLALNEKSFQALRKMIMKFHDDICKLGERPKKQELYRVCVQAFPLTIKE